MSTTTNTNKPSNSAAPSVLFETIPTAGNYVFGRATLNAPATLNALSLDMVKRLDERLSEWAANPGVAGVLLDATGDKAFSAGGDVVTLCHAIRALPAGQVPAVACDFFAREYRLDHRIHTYPKPLICWGNGIVMGGGLGLMAGASHRVATPKTRMAMPEINIGLFPDVGASWFLSRLPGRVGLFMALTGASLDAADALFAGLADFVLPHEAHSRLMSTLGAASWHGDRDLDDACLSELLTTLGAGLTLPPSALRKNLDRVNAVIGRDDRLLDVAPRLDALASDGEPWLAQAGQTFAKGSPSTAALAVALHERARHLSLADTFRLELQAALGCCAHPDFAEGVRALLVDKDKKPRWQPATLAEITSDWIEDHLRPRFDGPHPLADLG